MRRGFLLSACLGLLWSLWSLTPVRGYENAIAPMLPEPQSLTAPLPDFTVNSSGDASDANPGNGVCETAIGNGTCTLRAAMQEANARTGAQTIAFDASITAVEPVSPLPALNDASGGTKIQGNPTTISGASAGTGSHGFILDSNNNRLQSLYIAYFDRDGVQVSGDNNVIGVDGNGTGDTSEGNVISNNGGNGISLSNGATGVRISGNLIGLTPDGQTAAGNDAYGVYISDGAHANLIGTNGDGISDTLERNIISGNDRAGVFMWEEGTDQNAVAGNYIGTNASGNAVIPNGWSGVIIDTGSANNRIGTDGNGTADALEGNLISGNADSGVSLRNTNGNVIAGNLVGVNAAGDVAFPNDGHGVTLNAATGNRIGTNADGIADALERNVISGNNSSGIHIYTAENNIIAGNYIGTNVAGNMAIPNKYRGVHIQASSNNRVGGIVTAERNVISGNLSDGIRVYAGANVNVIQGNYIGVAANGSSDLGNKEYGVDISQGCVGNSIGGFANGEGNRIAFNDLAGIRVSEYGTAYSYNNSLRGNAVFANSGLGIDLWASEAGVTPNDPGDADSGPNHLQNFPVLSTITAGDNQVVIVGTLTSTSNTAYALDFYANSVCDPSGYGEGERYLGAANVSTGNTGHANFTVTLPVNVIVGQRITATATDPDGNTSEFSACCTANSVTTVFLPLVVRNIP